MNLPLFDAEEIVSILTKEFKFAFDETLHLLSVNALANENDTDDEESFYSIHFEKQENGNLHAKIVDETVEERYEFTAILEKQ